MTNRNGISIRYGDVTPEAKESFEPSSNDALFDTIDQLQRYNVDFPDFSNPCDYYSTRLDGVAKPIPSDPADEDFGFWSKQIASDGGMLSPAPTIFLSSDRPFSSKGLTLTFDTQNDIYPTEIYIQWKLDDEIVESETFFCDSAEYFCDKSVEGYNGLIIEFYSMNMPYSRLKLRAIDFGKGTIFYGKELRNVKLIQEIDPVSSQISINTADFTLDSAGKTNYNFQARQPINVFFNGELLSTTFVKKSTRKSSFLWQLQTEDYIGVMEGVSYYGGIYVSEDAVNLMADIFNTAKVPFEISDELAGAKVTGYIPYTTCRDALMQVAFAIQAVVDTSNSDVVRVFTLDNNIKQTIPLNRIMQGQNFTDKEVVTGVEVASHTYKTTSEVTTAYEATEDESDKREDAKTAVAYQVEGTPTEADWEKAPAVGIDTLHKRDGWNYDWVAGIHYAKPGNMKFLWDATASNLYVRFSVNNPVRGMTGNNDYTKDTLYYCFNFENTTTEPTAQGAKGYLTFINNHPALDGANVVIDRTITLPTTIQAGKYIGFDVQQSDNPGSTDGSRRAAYTWSQPNVIDNADDVDWSKLGQICLSAFNVQNPSRGGTGKNIFVKFSEPLHDLSIKNGKINHSGANYAIIDAEFGCVLTGQKYEHAVQVKRVDNPNISKNEPENVVAVESATLVSQHNIDNVLEKCYNWFIRTNEISLKIIEGKHDAGGEVTYDEKTLVGDKVTCDTEYLGQKTGRIIRQTFGLSGGIIVKDSVLK